MMPIDVVNLAVNVAKTAGVVGLLLTIWYARENRIAFQNMSKKLDGVLFAQFPQFRNRLGRFTKPGATILLALLILLIFLVALSLSWYEDGSSLRPTVVPADQIGYVGQPLPSPVAVQVQTDSVPVEGATIMFAPTSGGTATPDAVATDSAGRAQTVWTLGCQSGKQTLVARVLGGGSISIPATAQPASVPTRIEITPGSVQLTSVGDTAGFSARIVDQCGNDFPGEVVWSSIRQCVFRAGSDGLATALMIGKDSIVATFDHLRATASVTVEAGAR